jgi:putative oxidoreductase
MPVYYIDSTDKIDVIRLARASRDAMCRLVVRDIRQPARTTSEAGGEASRIDTMASLESSLDRLRPEALAVLRIMTALLFLAHGTGKLFGFPDIGFQAELFSLVGVSAVLELVGGILLVLGLFTRPVAFILSGEMAVAYFMAHAPQGFFPIVNQGELAVLYCFVFLYFVFAGAGAWSVDSARTAPGRLAYHH